MIDEDVPIFWRSLGLPGLIDVHVHFYPQRMLEKVWAYFDRAFWPITYRGSDGPSGWRSWKPSASAPSRR